MKILYFDLETTGLNPAKNGIHQISGILEVDKKVITKINFKVQPNPICQIEEDALKVAGVTKEQIMAYPPMSDIHKQLTELLALHCNKFDKADKLLLCGYNNASFDNLFLRGFFLQNKDNYFGSWFWSASIDVMVLAAHYLINRRVKMTDFKLKTVAKELGIEVDDSKLHDAFYDVELTKKIYDIIRLDFKSK